MSRASEKAKATRHERECLRREAMERKQVLKDLKKVTELRVIALQNGSRLPFQVRPLKKNEPRDDQRVLYTFEKRLHVLEYQYLRPKNARNVHGIILEHFMVDCEECGGSGEVEQTCFNCNVVLTSDNIHENSEHEACKKCGDEAEAEWDESNDR